MLSISELEELYTINKDKYVAGINCNELIFSEAAVIDYDSDYKH